ncbi:MAG: serine/threonine protein kinase [Herbiconiux sp.]|uniref:serine/threonine-protein kinase n=1 Tax=Herbiconiux sp. TaxID=1871186 RepID=UPI00122BB3AF|nr:serine/threonine protein kinase [Herbiconiux sp.]TAJ46849.1 MAG: serine/threonine protein kinase [Herbiconiux sp.]
MTPPSPQSPPPPLPGFDYLDTLGSGGFAEVHLYEQHLPRRRVAVKVLTGGVLDEASARQFRDEANQMAQLSSHPSIVTVYQAGIAQTGQAYLVMEYCALPNYGERYRHEVIPLEEALSVGVQIAGAVETAHRAGILHRDIKPANILVTDFHRPALADFGIAGVLGSSTAVDAYSVPWASPESLGEGGVLRAPSDVYSLAATVYTLLAGRAPFEIPGGDNSPEALIHRLNTGPAPATGRPDVPPELEAVLATALSLSPAARHTTALSFGRALQQVQQQYGLAVTPMDAIDDPFTRTGAGMGATGSYGGTVPPGPAYPTGGVPLAGTVPGGAVGTGPATGATEPPTTPYPYAPAPQTAPTVAYAPQPPTTPTVAYAQPSGAPLESTVRRAPAPSTAPVYTAEARRRPRWPGVVLDLVLVLGVAGAAAYLVFGG